MRAAAPRNGVPWGTASATAGGVAGAAAGGAEGAVATGAVGAAGAGVAAADPVPGEYPAKNSRQLSLTDEGSVRNCSNISSTSHALGPAMGEAESSATLIDSIAGAGGRWQWPPTSRPIDSATVLRIVTWNVNSLKARLPRVEQWLSENGPEVICLQETKMKDSAFPAEVFNAMGYETAHHGQGQWNGVAILSKVGLEDVVAGWDDDGPEDTDARILWATCGGVRVASSYVPNGRALDDPHYTYKLGWLERLRQTLLRREDAGSELAVCGDFNICPDDRDVWSPEAWVGNTHVSEPEREALRSLEAWGLEDVYRRHHDEGGLYSFWDYRGGDFHQGRGLRIDLIMATASLAARSVDARVDRDARKGEKPSDHAPVIAQFD